MKKCLWMAVVAIIAVVWGTVSWSKEEIKISDSTKVLALMPVIAQRRSAFRGDCEVSLQESLDALMDAQKSLMNGGLKWA